MSIKDLNGKVFIGTAPVRKDRIVSVNCDNSNLSLFLDNKGVFRDNEVNSISIDILTGNFSFEKKDFGHDRDSIKGASPLSEIFETHHSSDKKASIAFFLPYPSSSIMRVILYHSGNLVLKIEMDLDKGEIVEVQTNIA